MSRRQEHALTYNSWHNMRQRCSNPNASNYKNYGGRGITICAEWGSFERFLADMGDRPSAGHSIERRDNSGNYEPGNCYWATTKQQNRSQRRTRYMRFHGRNVPVADVADVADALGWISADTIKQRLDRGLSDDEALWPINTAPLLPPKPNGGRLGHAGFTIGTLEELFPPTREAALERRYDDWREAATLDGVDNIVAQFIPEPADDDDGWD